MIATTQNSSCSSSPRDSGERIEERGPAGAVPSPAGLRPSTSPAFASAFAGEVQNGRPQAMQGTSSSPRSWSGRTRRSTERRDSAAVRPRPATAGRGLRRGAPPAPSPLPPAFGCRPLPALRGEVQSVVLARSSHERRNRYIFCAALRFSRRIRPTARSRRPDRPASRSREKQAAGHTRNKAALPRDGSPRSDRHSLPGEPRRSPVEEPPRRDAGAYRRHTASAEWNRRGRRA